jgi:hypothetical protein
MASPRTIRTLAALVVAMTAGTFSLMLLETDPVGSSVNDFATIVAPAKDHFQALSQTRVPVQPEKWRSIVLESADTSRTLPPSTHLIVRIETDGDGDPFARVEATDLWIRQQESASQHTPTGSIVVCMVGDFRRTNPTVDVFQTVVGLTQRLQRIAEIAADRVYLPGDYDARGPQFTPAFSTAFHNNLLR